MCAEPGPPESTPAAAGANTPPIMPHRFDSRGLVAPTPGAADPWSHRRGEPRTFAALWILILLASVALTLGGVGLTGLLSQDTYRPAARALIVVVAVCLSLLWPMIRLSQQPPARPRTAFLADALLVLAPIPAVLAPQGFSWMAHWPWGTCGCLLLWFAAWVFLEAALLVVYFERLAPRMPRWVAMTGLAVVASGAPLAMALGPRDSSDAGRGSTFVALMMFSPVSGAAEICADRSWAGKSAMTAPGHWRSVALVLGLAAGGWTVALTRPRARVAAARENA